MTTPPQRPPRAKDLYPPKPAKAQSSRRKGKYWTQVRLFVLARDGWVCQIRGPHCSGRATEVDHIVAVAHGGLDLPGNLRAACLPCNRRHATRADERSASRDWGAFPD